jgi:hypothetical protein
VAAGSAPGLYSGLTSIPAKAEASYLDSFNLAAEGQRGFEDRSSGARTVLNKLANIVKPVIYINI